MYIKNRLHRKDRFRKSTDIISTYTDIGVRPIMIKEKNVKKKRRRKGRRNHKEKMVCIPIEINQRSFLEKSYRIELDIMENEHLTNRNNIINVEPLEYTKSVNSLLKSKHIPPRSESTLKITPELLESIVDSTDTKNKMIKMYRKDVHMNSQDFKMSKKPANINQKKFNSEGDSTAIVSNGNFTASSESLTSLNISTPNNTSPLSPVRKSNMSIIVRDQIRNFYDNRLQRYVTNKLVIKKSFKYRPEDLIGVKESRRIKNGIRNNHTLEKIFGFEEYFELRRFKNLTNLKKAKTGKIRIDTPLDRTNTPHVKNKRLGSKQKDAIENTYQSTRDPSDYFIGIDSIKSSLRKGDKISRQVSTKNPSPFIATALRSSTLISGNDSRKKRKLNINAKDLMLRNSIFGKHDLGRDIKSNGAALPVKMKRIAVKKIVFLKISHEDLRKYANISDNVQIRIRVVNQKGLNLFSRKEMISLKDVEFDYAIDNQRPMSVHINTQKTKNKGKRSYSISIKKDKTSDHNINASAHVYLKTFPSGEMHDKSKFSHLLNAIFNINHPEKNKFNINSEIGGKLNRYVSSPVMIRSLTKIFTSSNSHIMLNNIETSQISTRSHGSRNSSEKIGLIAFPDPQSDKSRSKFKNGAGKPIGTVKLSLDKYPKNAKKINILRRDLDSNFPKKFKRVTQKNARLEGLGINAKPLEKARLDTKSSADFFDNTAVHGKNYEYAIEVIQRNGNKKVLPKKFKTNYSTPSNLINTQLTDLSIDLRSSGFNFRLKMDRNESTVVSNIKKAVKELEVVASSTDLNKSLLGPELEKVKNTLNSLDSAELELQNLTDGTSTSLGIYNNSDHINVKTAIPVGKGVIVCNPIANDFNSSLNSVLDSFDKISGIDKINLGSDLKIKNLRESLRENIKINNTQNREYFKNGKKISASPGIGNINAGLIGKFTGDIIQTKIFKPLSKDISIDRISLGSRITHKNRVLLSFKCIGSIENVDFLIISCKKEGVEKPVGTAMFAHSSDMVNFVDYTNEKYVGNIDYYARAVYEDGMIGKKMFIVNITILRNIMEKM